MQKKGGRRLAETNLNLFMGHFLLTLISLYFSYSTVLSCVDCGEKLYLSHFSLNSTVLIWNMCTY